MRRNADYPFSSSVRTESFLSTYLSCIGRAFTYNLIVLGLFMCHCGCDNKGEWNIPNLGKLEEKINP
jgi:hypothetical protein